jgi:hypothetical protein
MNAKRKAAQSQRYLSGYSVQLKYLSSGAGANTPGIAPIKLTLFQMPAMKRF